MAPVKLSFFYRISKLSYNLVIGKYKKLPFKKITSNTSNFINFHFYLYTVKKYIKYYIIFLYLFTSLHRIFNHVIHLETSYFSSFLFIQFLTIQDQFKCPSSFTQNWPKIQRKTSKFQSGRRKFLCPCH